MSQENLTLSLSTFRKLKKAGVTVVYFFGSRAAGNYFPFSDIDVGVVMEDKQLTADTARKFHNIIYDILSSDIPDEFNGSKLDISFLQLSNPILAMKAIREGIILFESSAKQRANFEEAVFKNCDDYRMLQYEYEDANLRPFTNTMEK